ncbi:hypothetical protein DGWBC_1456 [Dehalogenimonas sp. WBC-2]|nr:hypothetical protein DGWBC_1456 [Dehalogenimonas sp. WBC-2]
MPSEIMADEPVSAAATNFMIATIRFPMIAATITAFDPCLLFKIRLFGVRRA